jgi:hypothetical protein
MSGDVSTYVGGSNVPAQFSSGRRGTARVIIDVQPDGHGLFPVLVESTGGWGAATAVKTLAEAVGFAENTLTARRFDPLAPGLVAGQPVAYVAISTDLLDRLRAALLTPAVGTMMAEEIGDDAAATLLSELMAL